MRYSYVDMHLNTSASSWVIVQRALNVLLTYGNVLEIFGTDEQFIAIADDVYNVEDHERLRREYQPSKRLSLTYVPTRYA